jgi:hypothetical protein
LIISERLYFILCEKDKTESIDIKVFVNNIEILFRTTFEDMLALTFNMYNFHNFRYDFDSDGFIQKHDVLLVWNNIIYYDEINKDNNEYNETNISIEINKIGKNASLVDKQIDELFNLEDKINLKRYTQIAKEDNSDLFMMVFYYLRKVSKIVDDSMIQVQKPTHDKLMDKLASPFIICLRPNSPTKIDLRPTIRSGRKKSEQISRNEESFGILLQERRLPSIDSKDILVTERRGSNDSKSSLGSSKNIKNNKWINFNKINEKSIYSSKGKVLMRNQKNIVSTPTNKDDYYSKQEAFRMTIRNSRLNSEQNSRSNDSERQRYTNSNSSSRSKPKMNKGNVLNLVGRKQSINIVTSTINQSPKSVDFSSEFAKKHFSSNRPSHIDSNNTLALFSGYIYKFNSTQTELKKYWFVLKNFKLLYFSEKEKKYPVGLINLIKCFIKKDGKVSIFNKPLYSFHIYHNLHRESFFCEDSNSLESWVFNINNFCESKESISNYKIKDFIGQGKFSVVHRGIRVDNNSEVAVKIIRKSKMEDIDLECTRREISILQICEHPHIIKMKSFYENYEYIYIIQELFPSTDLFDYLQHREFTISEETAKIMIRQLISAVDYMHHLGIVHRDIKPENILIKESVNKVTNKKEILMKIIDFGLSRFLAKGELVKGEPFGTMV